MKRPFYIYIGEAEDRKEAESLLENYASSNDGSELLANAEPLFFINPEE